MIEIKIAVTPEQARKTATEYLGGEIAVDRKFLGSIENHSESSLYFVPFLELEGFMTVRCKTKKYKEIRFRAIEGESRDRSLHRLRTKKIDPKSLHFDTRIQIHEFHHITCGAVDLGWGLDRFVVTDEMIRIVADPEAMQRRGIVLAETISPDFVEKQHQIIGIRDSETMRDIVFQIKRRCYVPVWRITTRFEDQIYEAFIEAATGVCVKASAPQGVKSRVTAFCVNFALIAFFSSGLIILSRFIFRMVAGDLLKVLSKIDLIVIFGSMPVLGLVTVLAAIAGSGWERLRYRSEIVKTGERTLIHTTENFGDTWLNRVHEKTLEVLTRQLEDITDIHE